MTPSHDLPAMTLRSGRLGRFRHLAASLVIAMAAAGVAGCAGSPATNYYTLSGIAPNTVAPSSRTAPAIVALGPVTMPDYLDRPQIVTRDGAYTLKVAAYDQWLGPLYDMVPRVLVDDLGARLPGDRVVAFPQITGASFDYRASVDINRFDVDGTGAATLVARWQLYDPSRARALVVADETIQRHADGKDYEAYVAALSATLAELSDRMASALVAERSSTPRPIAER